MNLAQIIRKARMGVDAILPGGSASAQWGDEEMADTVNEAYEALQREFRLLNSKWGLRTINTSTTAYSREGETYTPSTALVLSSTNYKITLPPDFAEIVRIRCTSNRDTRFVPAQAESYHWIDLEDTSWDESGTPYGNEPPFQTFFYDLIDNRTLYIVPITGGTYNLEIDYIPMKRPLYYSNAGSIQVTNGATGITGTGTRWMSDSLYTEDTGSRAELVPGISDIQSNLIRLDVDYPRIASFTSDTVATLKANYAGTTVASGLPYIFAMAPDLPREYHRWICRLASSLMLSKVNPEVADKYFARFMEQFRTQVNPSAKKRQSQDSRVTEDAVEFAAGGDF